MRKINNPTSKNVLNMGPFIHMGKDVRLQTRMNLESLNYSKAKKGEVAPLVFVFYCMCSTEFKEGSQWERFGRGIWLSG